MLGMPMPLSPHVGGSAVGGGGSANRAMAPDMAKVCKDLRQLLSELSPSQLSDSSEGEAVEAGGMSSSLSSTAGKSSEALVCAESKLGAEGQSAGPSKKPRTKMKGGKDVEVIDLDVDEPGPSKGQSGSPASSARGSRRGNAGAGAPSQGSKPHLIVLD